MLGETTTAALVRSVAPCRAAAATAILLFSFTFAHADPDDTPAWREVWAGADVTSHVWLVYSGVTIAPYSDMFSDGLRLRSAAGYGGYTYTGNRGTQVQGFKANTQFADFLVGYLKRLGPLTAKAFVGVSSIRHDVRPYDAANPVQGLAIGPKGVAELWLNMGSDAWSSLDASWTSAHQTYSGRLRSGYRIVGDLSLGAEARIDGNALDRDARGGLFVRYAWTGGEVSLAGGVSGRFLEDARDVRDGYATANWLMQY
jgi:Cellulose biosynthesis protein BcsS